MINLPIKRDVFGSEDAGFRSVRETVLEACADLVRRGEVVLSVEGK